jgi:hypothetical protein
MISNKVYVVQSFYHANGHEETEVEGVFSTICKANEYAFFISNAEDNMDVFVEEHEIDYCFQPKEDL